MDEAKARQAPHNVAVLVLPECGAVTGDRGGMQLEKIPDDLILLLLAGEVTHIGKNTSFGFGRYRLF